MKKNLMIIIILYTDELIFAAKMRLIYIIFLGLCEITNFGDS